MEAITYPTVPPPDPGDGVNRPRFIFSGHSHVAYQMKGRKNAAIW